MRNGTAGGVRSRSRGGFTVVEVVLAISLLAVAMAGVYRVLESAFRLRRAAHHHYLAVVIANNRIERAKSVDFNMLPLLGEDRVPVNDQGVPEPDGPFHRTTEVATGYEGNPRLARVRVTVETPPMRRHRRVPVTESVSTLLTEYVTL